ncbi:MAG: molybdate ABC transporter permease subunit [Rhodospirillales bacterium]|nr:molybdate ABC transporter permease subunit [Rhodospirillales bacterium]
MDWAALRLSLELAGWTSVLLLPPAILLARWLSLPGVRGRAVIEMLVALPLVLPPSVLGYYLLGQFGAAAPLGRLWQGVFGHPLAFSFEGLLIASLLVNIPFAVQPILRAFEGIPREVREAAWCSGLSRLAAFRRIELPLARSGVTAAFALVFAHTLGEFGVVLMVGGNISGATRTLSIAIYDRVQAFDDSGAGAMAALLLVVSVAVMALVYLVTGRGGRRG